MLIFLLISEIDHFIPPSLEGYKVAIGSREVPGAKRFNEPMIRHFTGRIFNFIVRLIAVPNNHDTQCGFKCFSAKAAETLFRMQKIDGWAFDAEVLFIAQHLGYEIIEVPVQWYYNENSKINILQDSIKMLGKLIQIQKNYRSGLYKKFKFQHIERRYAVFLLKMTDNQPFCKSEFIVTIIYLFIKII